MFYNNLINVTIVGGTYFMGNEALGTFGDGIGAEFMGLLFGIFATLIIS